MSDALCHGKLSVLSMARLERLKRKDLLTSIYCLVEFLKILFQLNELDGVFDDWNLSCWWRTFVYQLFRFLTKQ